MSTKSNIVTHRRKSDIYSVSVDNPPLPPEEWPDLIEPSLVIPLATTDPDPDSTIVQLGALWSTPPAPVTFVTMAAAVQVSPTPPVNEGVYNVIKEVGGSEEMVEDLGLGLVYSSLFGFFTPSDVGKYVPYIMKFIDEYDREHIVKTDVGLITAP